MQPVQIGTEQAQGPVLWRFGQNRVEIGPRLGDLAGLNLSLHNGQHGRQRLIGLTCTALQQRQTLVDAVLSGQNGGLHLLHFAVTVRQVQRLKLLHGGPGQGPLALFKVIAHLRAQDVRIVRRDLAGIGQHGFHHLSPAQPDQELGIAQGFSRGGPRDFNRFGQLVTSQIQGAVAFMGGGHQGQNLGVARVLVKGGAQIDNRGTGFVITDEPDGPQLEGCQIGGVLGQNLLDQGPCPDAVGGGIQHAGQNGLEVAGLIRGVRGFEDGLHGGNRGVLLTVLEIHRGAQTAIKVGPGKFGGRSALIGRDQRVQFGPCRRGTAGGLQKLHQRQMGIGRTIRRPCQLAQKRLGPVEILLQDIPADQGRGHLGVVGEHLEHALERVAGALGILGLGQNAEFHHV